MPRRRVKAELEYPRLYSLTGEQARTLQEAANTPGGLYVPLTQRAEVMHALVHGGAAEYREERRWSNTTRGPRDSTPIGWLTDYFIIPTEWGLELLVSYNAR